MTVAGDVDLVLLPVPIVTFNDVRIGDREGESMMTVQRFSARLEIPPLASGDVQFDEIELDRPRLTVNVDDSGQLDWALGPGTLPTVNLAIGLQSVTVTNGYLAFTDGRSGVHAELANINTSRVTARSLVGPWIIEGTASTGGVPLAFRVSTSALQGDVLRVTADLDVGGALPLTGAIHGDGSVAMTEGQLAYSGSFRHQQFSTPGDEETPRALLATASGRFVLTSAGLSVSEFVWAPETGDATQEFTGAGVISFGTAAGFDVRLATRQIDVDRLIGSVPSAPVPLGKALDRLILVPPALPALPIDGHVELSVPSMVLAGSVVKDLLLSADHANGAWFIDDVEASLPGQSTLRASGTLAIQPALFFTGALEIETEQPENWADWVFGPHGGTPLRSIGHLSLQANAEAGSGSLKLTEVEAVVDGKPVRGAAEWERQERGARLEVSAAAASLPVEVVQGLAALREVRLAGPGSEVAEVAVALKVDEVTTAEGAPLGSLDIDAALSRSSLRLNHITVGDFAGGTLFVSGTIEEPFGAQTGTLTARLDATDLDTLSSFMRILAPGEPISARLADGAAVLSPAHLSATFEVGEEPGVSIHLAGTLASTDLDGTFKLVGAGRDPLATLAAWREAEWTATLAVDSPDAERLAEQAGFEIVSIADFSLGTLRLSDGAAALSAAGPATLALAGGGRPNGTLAGSLKGTFAGVDLDLTGEITLLEGQTPAASIDLGVTSEDIDPLLMLAGLALPGTGLGTPLRLHSQLTLSDGAARLEIGSAELADSAVTGAVTARGEADGWRLDGAIGLDRLDLNWLVALELGTPIEAGGAVVEGSVWSADAIGPPLSPRLRGELTVDAAHLFASGSDLAVDAAALVLHFQPDALAAELKTGTAFGTSISGTLTVRNSGGDAALSGSLAMTGADLAAMSWRDGAAPVADGLVDLAFDFETTGRSVAGLWSNLAGGGTLGIRDATFQGVGASVFDGIIGTSDAGTVFTEEQLVDTVTGSFAGAEISVAEASATFTIIGGTLEAANIAVDLGELDAAGDLNIDFNALTLDSLWQLSLADPEALVVGAPPEINLLFSGLLAAPIRVIDVGSLLAYLNLRTLDREVKLLENAQAPAPPAAAPPAATLNAAAPAATPTPTAVAPTAVPAAPTPTAATATAPAPGPPTPVTVEQTPLLPSDAVTATIPTLPPPDGPATLAPPGAIPPALMSPTPLTTQPAAPAGATP